MPESRSPAGSRRPKSKELYDRALKVAPGGVQGSDIRGVRGGWEPFPIFMASGEGPYLIDVDGNRYIDYVAGSGPLILGHRPKPVLDAVHRTLDEMSQLLGLNHQLEVEAAEATINAVPSWEQMRFSNTGTEAVMLALRMARAYTNRSKVLCFEGHFHGWADTIYFSMGDQRAREAAESQFLSPVPNTHGMVESLIEDQLVLRPWNDPDVLRQTFDEFGDELAAAICEPLLCGPIIQPEPGYLELLRDLTGRHGVVLIYDEIKTSFRVALGGAQELYGVLPDISTAAKALGAGFPVAAVGGRKELFEPFTRGYIRQGSTYQANPIVLAAVLASLEQFREPGFYPRLNGQSAALTEGLTSLLHESGVDGYAGGVGSIIQLVFADHVISDVRDAARSNQADKYPTFWRGMLDGGVMVGPHGGIWFVSAAHGDVEIETTLDVAGDVLMTMASQANAN